MPGTAGKPAGILSVLPPPRQSVPGSGAAGGDLRVPARGAGERQLWRPADRLLAAAEAKLHGWLPAHLPDLPGAPSDDPAQAPRFRHDNGGFSGGKVGKPDSTGLYCRKTKRKAAHRYHRDPLPGWEAVPGGRAGLLRRQHSGLPCGRAYARGAVCEGTGGCLPEVRRQRDDRPLGPGESVHQPPLPGGAETVQGDSEHERHGAVLRQRQDGELFCYAEEGEALPGQHAHADEGGGAVHPVPLHQLLQSAPDQPGKRWPAAAGVPPAVFGADGGGLTGSALRVASAWPRVNGKWLRHGYRRH